jgi:hypothetical protein
MIISTIFLNKPTGQETGLSSSLNYDIIKAYDGQFK